MFQKVIDLDESERRRQLGAHYTSEAKLPQLRSLLGRHPVLRLNDAEAVLLRAEALGPRVVGCMGYVQLDPVEADEARRAKAVAARQRVSIGMVVCIVV